MDEFLMGIYDNLKAFHIIFVVTWFAGLFYIVRLFIYHTETLTKDSPEKEILQKQYKIMSKRLWNIITWPSAIITLVLATLLLMSPVGRIYLKEGWMHLKLAFVFLLYVYHILCHFLYKQLQNNIIKYSSKQLRIFNEIPTLLLFSVVFLVVLKNSFNWIYGVLGFFSLMIVLMIGIRIYKKLRDKK